MAALRKRFFTPLLAALAVATTLASAGPAMAGLSARVEAAPVSDVGAMTSNPAATTAEPQTIDQADAKEDAQDRAESAAGREALAKSRSRRHAEHVAPREARPAPRSVARSAFTRVSMGPRAPCHRWR